MNWKNRQACTVICKSKGEPCLPDLPYISTRVKNQNHFVRRPNCHFVISITRLPLGVGTFRHREENPCPNNIIIVSYTRILLLFHAFVSGIQFRPSAMRRYRAGCDLNNNFYTIILVSFPQAYVGNVSLNVL